MKALKIYEVLDFERGIDPKESMNIGLRDLKPGYVIQAKLNLRFNDDLSLSPRNISGISTFRHRPFYPEKENFKKGEYIVINEVFNREDGYVSAGYFRFKDLEKALERSTEIGSAALEKLYASQWFIIKPKDIKSFFKLINIENGISESVNFERGKEPKKSMEIGQNYIKQILIDLFPHRDPGERDFELHRQLINVILRTQFVVSINKEDNIITVRDTGGHMSYSGFENLFDVMIDHINLYSFPLKPKIARIVDPMAAAKRIIHLKIFKE